MLFNDSAIDALYQAEQNIVQTTRNLRTELDKLARPYSAHSSEYEILARQSRIDFEQILNMIEVNGTDISFASAVERFVGAANYWNQHAFSRVRAGNGDISVDASGGFDTLKVIIYTDRYSHEGDRFTQAFDIWGDLVEFCETSCLRTMESMQYILEYYGNLMNEVQSTFAFLTTTKEMSKKETKLFNTDFEELQYRMLQIQYGFETNAAWLEQRPTTNIAILERQQQKAQEDQEREYRNQRAERAAEHQRKESQRVREEHQRKIQEKQALEDQRMKNQRLRWKIRERSENIEDFLPLHQGNQSAAIDTYSKGLLVPFAVHFVESGEDDVGRELKNRRAPPPWPRGGTSERN